jgi:hypothetical protein
MEQEGISIGEVCNRNGCTAIISEHEKEGCCSCHVNPPCGYCTTDASYCPGCDWDGREEQIEYNNQQFKNYIPSERVIKYKTINDLDKTKIDWISESHTHFSMIKIGVYPEGVTMDQVLENVRGTFGGRFQHFGDGRFRYVAYTD